MKGQTKNPCNGCGAVGPRLINKVCNSCTQLLSEAQGARERQAQDTAHGLYLHSKVPHWNPGYYDSGASGHAGLTQARDTIQKTFTALVMAIAEPAVGHPVMWGDDRAPFLLDRRNRAGDYHSRSGMEYIKMPVPVRDALNVLDGAVRAFEVAGYRAGKQNGENLLGRLAAGEVGLTEFDTKREK